MVDSQRHRAARQFEVRPKKRLGQHFLTDRAVVECILSAAGLSADDVVVEVGPGTGILTDALARSGATVIAVELDSRMVALLRKRLIAFPNVRVVHGDILKVSPQELLGETLRTSGAGYKVVANLPYYIASPVLSHFLDRPPRPSRMVIMVQKEVGEAIAATPGKMRLLSVKTQLYSSPSIVCHVPAASFRPPPKVDSVVLRLDVYAEPPVQIPDTESFLDIVMHGFSAPRKQIRNSLAHSLQLAADLVDRLLRQAGVEGNRRAETLSLEEWRRLREVFAPHLDRADSASSAQSGTGCSHPDIRPGGPGGPGHSGTASRCSECRCHRDGRPEGRPNHSAASPPDRTNGASYRDDEEGE